MAALRASIGHIGSDSSPTLGEENMRGGGVRPVHASGRTQSAAEAPTFINVYRLRGLRPQLQGRAATRTACAKGGAYVSHRGCRVEDDLSPVQGEPEPVERVVAPVADVHPDAAVGRLEHRMARVPLLSDEEEGEIRSARCSVTGRVTGPHQQLAWSRSHAAMRLARLLRAM